MRLSIVLGVISVLLFISCGQDGDSVVVETELQEYFDLFVQEAAERDI